MATLLLLCSLLSTSVADALLTRLEKRSFFPITPTEVGSLLPVEERSRLRELPYEQPQGLTYLRWEADDHGCYAQFSPHPDVSAQPGIERIQLGCLYATRTEAVAAARKWVGDIDPGLARRLRVARRGDHYSVHKVKGREDKLFSLEVRIQSDGKQWGTDLVLLDHYPPAYVY